MSSEMISATADLDEQRVQEWVREGLANGVSPAILLHECREGLGIVGERFQAGEYYLAELMMAGEIFRGVAAQLPVENGPGSESKGKVIVGTVAGDIHNIDKDLVIAMLQAAGFEVEDLGVDVPPAVFVERTTVAGATVLAMSGLITPSFDAMKETVEVLKSAGLRDKVKVMIGGGPITADVMDYVGADGFGNDAHSAVVYAQRWRRMGRSDQGGQE